jgi:hypothetical protein
VSAPATISFRSGALVTSITNPADTWGFREQDAQSIVTVTACPDQLSSEASFVSESISSWSYATEFAMRSAPFINNAMSSAFLDWNEPVVMRVCDDTCGDSSFSAGVILARLVLANDADFNGEARLFFVRIAGSSALNASAYVDLWSHNDDSTLSDMFSWLNCSDDQYTMAGVLTCVGAGCPSCSNGVLDSFEQEVDCGGLCPDACFPPPPAPQAGLFAPESSYAFAMTGNVTTQAAVYVVPAGSTLRVQHGLGDLGGQFSVLVDLALDLSTMARDEYRYSTVLQGSAPPQCLVCVGGSVDVPGAAASGSVTDGKLAMCDACERDTYTLARFSGCSRRATFVRCASWLSVARRRAASGTRHVCARAACGRQHDHTCQLRGLHQRRAFGVLCALSH